MRSKKTDEGDPEERTDSIRLKGVKNNKTDSEDSSSVAKKTTFSPDALIRAAIRAHPAFKFAIASAGLAALVAISQRWGISPATLVFGSIIMVGLMILFLVFSIATKAEKKLHGPAFVLVWSTTLIVVAVFILLVVSAFFNAPLRFKDVLEHAMPSSETKNENQNKTTEESLELAKLAAKINDENNELQKKLEDVTDATDDLVRGIEELRIVSITNLAANADIKQVSEKIERLIRDYDRLSKHRGREVQKAHELAVSAKVELAWNQSSGPDVAGYNLYVAERPGSPTSVINAGTNLSIYVPNLQTGKTYYFYVTAYDSSGFESDFSEPVTYTVLPQIIKD